MDEVRSACGLSPGIQGDMWDERYTPRSISITPNTSGQAVVAFSPSPTFMLQGMSRLVAWSSLWVLWKRSRSIWKVTENWELAGLSKGHSALEVQGPLPHCIEVWQEATCQQLKAEGPGGCCTWVSGVGGSGWSQSPTAGWRGQNTARYRTTDPSTRMWKDGSSCPKGWAPSSCRGAEAMWLRPEAPLPFHVPVALKKQRGRGAHRALWRAERLLQSEFTYREWEAILTKRAGV